MNIPLEALFGRAILAEVTSLLSAYAHVIMLLSGSGGICKKQRTTLLDNSVKNPSFITCPLIMRYLYVCLSLYVYL